MEIRIKSRVEDMGDGSYRHRRKFLWWPRCFRNAGVWYVRWLQYTYILEERVKYPLPYDDYRWVWVEAGFSEFFGDAGYEKKERVGQDE